MSREKNQYNILRCITFRPYSNKFYKHREKGTYNCKVCGRVLFLSKTKYEAGTGWPSFYDVIDKEAVVYRPDASGGRSQIHFTEYYST